MKVLKLFWNLLCHMIKHKDHYISRGIRSLHEKPTKHFKVLPPLYFDEAVFVIIELAEQHPPFKEIFREATTSHEFVSQIHHGVGRNIRNEWKLWDTSSCLHKSMVVEFGLFHADDMSGVLLQVAWQRFRCLPETPGIIAMGYTFYWQDMKKKGNWDGMAHDKMVDFSFSQHHRKRVAKEKVLLEKYNK